MQSLYPSFITNEAYLPPAAASPIYISPPTLSPHCIPATSTAMVITPNRYPSASLLGPLIRRITCANIGIWNYNIYQYEVFYY